MTIIVTGGTGRIGQQIIHRLVGQGEAVRALTRAPEKADLPTGVEPVRGDLLDVASLREAFRGVDTLFVLAANAADELTQAMLAVDAAREAGVRGLVYLSVIRADTYTDVPHFAGKHTVERMLADGGPAATVLRPAYFYQNDLAYAEPLTQAGLYAAPIGARGIAMVDTGDIAEAAARELLRRARAAAPLPPEALEVVGPDVFTGEGIAQLWSEVLGRPVRYGGDDLEAMERQLAARGPAWLARDMRLMMARYQQDGAAPAPGAVERLTALLGRPPRAYRDFAAEAAAGWAAAAAKS